MDPQILTALVLLAAMGLFIWGRWRYDLVALLALLSLCLAGAIPVDRAFAGFAHPAVITVAAVLIISRGLSAVVQPLAEQLGTLSKSPVVLVGILTTLVTVLSGFINNVGALALLMPVAIRVARDAGHPPSLLLMPLAFGSLLGGMLTLIGTPPNIIIAAYREQIIGTAFRMFDFTPVGAGAALAGVLFIALAGWRLLPRRKAQASREQLFEIEDYISEVHVGEKSKAVGRQISELEEENEDEVMIVGLVRNGQRAKVPSYNETLRSGDTLIVEADAERLKSFIEKSGLELAGKDKKGRPGKKALDSSDLTVLEATVLPESRLAGLSVKQINMRLRYGINLLGVARQGARMKQLLADIRFRAGDVLLLQGPGDNLYEALRNLGCLPLAERGLTIGQPRRIALALALFAGAIVCNALGLYPVQIAMTATAAFMVLLQVITLRDAYEATTGRLSSCSAPCCPWVRPWRPAGLPLRSLPGWAPLPPTCPPGASSRCCSSAPCC